MTDKKPADQSSRRSFVKNSTAAVVGGALVAGVNVPSVHAQGDDVIKVGLIGCGGRGSGAATNAVNAGPNIKLTVMADAFKNALNTSRKNLAKGLGEKMQVSDDNCFVGFDAYRQVMNTDVDVVLLCTPPHFRPAQLRAAIDAGKHVFCEKPVAVDGPGLRSVLDTVKLAKQKNLTIVSGLCWRYDYGVRETVKRIQAGAIGDIVNIQENYLTGTLWHRGRKANWSEMEYQLRNWLYFTWLSGDHIVEQHVHSLDKALWLMGDVPPVRCVGLGGRQTRTERKWGNIFDHFSVCYEFPNGKKTFAYTRQMSNCTGDVDDYVYGTKGTARLLRFSIKGENPWRYPRKKARSRPSMYDVEHRELFAGMRAGKIINNGEYMTYSTLMAIMGREACYTGQTVTADDVMKSNVRLGPNKYEFGNIKTPKVAKPGLTKLFS